MTLRQGQGKKEFIFLYTSFMDLTNVDMTALAHQLRKPTGEYGRQVGKKMADTNHEVTRFTIKCLDIQPTDHVLEIGFGPGEGIAQLVERTPKGFVAGIDFSEDMLAMAIERNQDAINQKRVELILGEAQEMPYKDESFDKMFAVNVFHFWEDPMSELAECRRALKSGGKIAFFMAYPSSYIPGLQESGVFISREPQDVEKILMDAGFIGAETKSITMGEYKGFAVIAEKK